MDGWMIQFRNQLNHHSSFTITKSVLPAFPSSQMRTGSEPEPRTVWSQGGVACLRDAPGAPLGAALAPGADPEQVVRVRVQM